MNKRFFVVLLGMLLGFTLNVQASGDTGNSDNLANEYFSTQNPKLSPQEVAAIQMAKKWQNSSPASVNPSQGADGSIRFLYGAQQPSIVCAVLQVCDVELQMGEIVNSIHIGDQARWIVEPAITGQGSAEVQHLIIKPMDVGLQTTLIVTTNRRTYHFVLKSHRSQFMPRVSFIYPEDATEKWNALKSRENPHLQNRQVKGISSTGEYLGDLDFAYSVSGAASWKPVRVYNDGHKTIIQMPKSMNQTEAPTLLLLNREGWLFREEETAIVNYRLQGDRYIVDMLFDKAILISGIGNSQSRVTIEREKKL